MAVYRLTFPRELKAEQVISFLTALAAQPLRLRRSPLLLEVVAEPGRISHWLHLPEGAGVLLRHLTIALPGLRFEQDDPPELVLTEGRELVVTSQRRALRTDDHGTASNVLAVLQPLHKGECLVVQWTLAPTIGPRPPRTSGPLPPPDWPWTHQPNREDLKEARDKLTPPLLRGRLRLAVQAGHAARRRQLLNEVTSAMRTAARPGVGLRLKLRSATRVATEVREHHVGFGLIPYRYNVIELAPLLGWPIDVPELPGLTRGLCRLLPVPSGLPTYGRVLADSTYPGSKSALRLTADDRRQHVHILGPTGSGKSVLLANLALQDAAGGDGLIVLDPKGDLITDVLGRLPERRHPDVIVFDPTDTRPVGLNLLNADAEQRELVVDSVVGIFHRLYASSWGPRTADVLRAALTTLVEAPDVYTLCEVPTLLTNLGFRRRLLKSVPDRGSLREFWEWYEATSEAERAQIIAPVLNKLRAITLRPSLRAVFGQERGLDVDAVFRDRRVLLVTLNQGALGSETAQLVGSLLLNAIWQAILRRGRIEPGKRRPVMVILDEFQDYLRLPIELGDLLAQARGLGVGLTLAHQHLAQLPGELRAAVLANARTKVVFGLARDDARLMAREFEPQLEEADLRGLPPYEVALKLFAAGAMQPPTTGRTRPLSEVTAGQVQRLRLASREHWGTPRTDVEVAISRRLEAGADQVRVGRVRHGDGS